MKFRKIGVTLFCLFALFLLPGSKLFKDDKSPEEQRQEILEMRTKTLNDLYKEIPGTKEAIEDSLGYAVFSSVNINVLAVSTVNGTITPSSLSAIIPATSSANALFGPPATGTSTFLNF